MHKYMLSFLILISLHGCVTYEDSRKKLVDSLPENEKSYLVGKYSVQCTPNASKTKCLQRFNSLSVFYKSVGGRAHTDRFDFTSGGAFGGDTVADKTDFEAGEKSIYFCRVLPAGEYSLFSIRHWNFAGGGSGYSLREEDHFNVPFKLEARQISNIDHLKLTTEQGKNMLGMPLALPGGMEISSLGENEVELAVKKCPEAAKSHKVIPQLLWKNKYESPFVTTKK